MKTWALLAIAILFFGCAPCAYGPNGSYQCAPPSTSFWYGNSSTFVGANAGYPYYRYSYGGYPYGAPCYFAAPIILGPVAAPSYVIMPHPWHYHNWHRR